MPWQHLIALSPGANKEASIEQQFELMEQGKVRTGEDIGAGWIDTTANSMPARQGKACRTEVFID